MLTKNLIGSMRSNTKFPSNIIMIHSLIDVQPAYKRLDLRCERFDATASITYDLRRSLVTGDNIVISPGDETMFDETSLLCQIQ